MQWYEPLQIEKCEDEKSLDIHFPHAFFGDWFVKNKQDMFENQISSFLGPGYLIRYHNINSAGRPAQETQPTRIKRTDYPFGQQQTFESFIRNNKNHFPLSMAEEVAKQMEIQFNPLIICGENGSGKSHLLRAIGNELSKTHGVEAIYFGNINDLYHGYMEKHQGNRHTARFKLSQYSFLLLDDFQQIRTVPDFQDELVNIFNLFYDQKKQMIFSCLDKPADYDFLNVPLKSRLEGGVIINLLEPDLDVRIKYIQHMCRIKKIKFSKEQMLTLAQRFKDFRFLQGILLKFFAFKKTMHKNITEKDFQQIISHTDSKLSDIDPKLIIQTVAEHYGVPLKTLFESRRDNETVQARQMAMYLCRILLGLSYPELGRLFGGKDHSTVMYAVKKIEKLQNDNYDTKTLVTRLKKTCQKNAGH